MASVSHDVEAPEFRFAGSRFMSSAPGSNNSCEMARATKGTRRLCSEGRRPVCQTSAQPGRAGCGDGVIERRRARHSHALERSEEHTSELQSRSDLVCRLL